MIVYARGPFGLPTLLGRCGSVLPRTALVGGLAAAATILLQLLGAGTAISRWWRAAVLPYQLFAFALGFVVTFRWARVHLLAAGSRRRLDRQPCALLR